MPSCISLPYRGGSTAGLALLAQGSLKLNSVPASMAKPSPSNDFPLSILRAGGVFIRERIFRTVGANAKTRRRCVQTLPKPFPKGPCSYMVYT